MKTNAGVYHRRLGSQRERRRRDTLVQLVGADSVAKTAACLRQVGKATALHERRDRGAKVGRFRGVALDGAKNFAADAFYCCMRRWTLYSAIAKSLVFGEIERSL